MIVLEGANKLKEESKYTIYTINSTNAGEYCVIVPNDASGTLEFLLDLHKKSLFDEVKSGTKTVDDLNNKMSEEYNKISTEHPNGILVIPMLNEEEYTMTINSKDKQKMFNETQKIGAITSEIYKKLMASGIDKSKINGKINIIEDKNEDELFVAWLKEQMPNSVEGIKFAPKEENNVLAGNNIFGIANEEAKVEAPEPAPQTNDIFASAQEQPTAPVNEPVSPVPETPAPQANDVFGAPTEKKEEPAPTAPIPAPVATEQVQEAPQATNLFATPQAPAAEPTPAVQEPVAPTPVQDVALEGTTTFSPIPNTPEQPAAPQQENANVKTLTRKKSGGFVNLAILLVVLVIVTIISIELGKFLYSVYGA